MGKTILYQSLESGQVQCHLCQRRCKINPESRGYCRARKNVDGSLKSLIYGRVSSIRVSPIEIKPLFHYYPGSQWLSMGSLGCNFLCPGCQNWEIAHADPEKDMDLTRYISPGDAVRLALDRKCKGISWTYNEPTLWFEYTLDCAKLARERRLFTNYVTNAFMTPEALDLIGPYLNAYRADLKGFSGETYRRLANLMDFGGILEIIEKAKKRWGMHVEIITNLVPGFNDDEEELESMAHWISTQLGPETPWHVTRFIPHLRLSRLPQTPISKLERAREIGIRAGLEYVYIGNVPGHPAENTYCPRCERLLIRRLGFQILEYHLSGNQCESCGAIISGKYEDS
jgi:pyruvate formate lyase activating enzyme